MLISKTVSASALAATLVLAGCSGSSKSSVTAASRDTATTTSTIPATTSTASASAAGTSEVAADVLKQADLPAGWQRTPHPADPTSGKDPQGAQLVACLGLPPADAADNSPSADSDDFALRVPGGQQTISNSISVGAVAAHEQEQMAALKGPKAPGCVNQLIAASLQQEMASVGPGAKLDPVNTAGVDLGHYLDSTESFRTTTMIVVSKPTGAQSIPVTSDFAFFQRGRYTAQFAFVGVGQAIDASVEKKAMAVVASRMQGLPAS